jgi:hypothetical protein
MDFNPKKSDKVSLNAFNDDSKDLEKVSENEVTLLITSNDSEMKINLVWKHVKDEEGQDAWAPVISANNFPSEEVVDAKDSELHMLNLFDALGKGMQVLRNPFLSALLSGETEDLDDEDDL